MFNKICRMVEDLHRFLYFHIFGIGVALVNENWQFANALVDLVCISICAKSNKGLLMVQELCPVSSWHSSKVNFSAVYNENVII